MGDDNDGAAVGSHVPEYREEFFCLLRGQDSCRLVQDQYIRAAVQDFDDLNGLFLGDGHLVDLLVRVKVESVLVHKTFDLFPHLIHL